MIDFKNTHITLKELFEYVSDAIATVDRQDRLLEVITHFPVVKSYLVFAISGYQDMDAVSISQKYRPRYKGKYSHDITFSDFFTKDLPHFYKNNNMPLIRKNGLFNRVVADMSADDVVYIAKALQGKFAFDEVIINNTVLGVLGLTKK